MGPAVWRDQWRELSCIDIYTDGSTGSAESEGCTAAWAFVVIGETGDGTIVRLGWFAGPVVSDAAGGHFIGAGSEDSLTAEMSGTEWALMWIIGVAATRAVGNDERRLRECASTTTACLRATRVPASCRAPPSHDLPR